VEKQLPVCEIGATKFAGSYRRELPVLSWIEREWAASGSLPSATPENTAPIS
jgi:hypothetical protein